MILETNGTKLRINQSIKFILFKDDEVAIKDIIAERNFGEAFCLFHKQNSLIILLSAVLSFLHEIYARRKQCSCAQVNIGLICNIEAIQTGS